MKPWIDFASDIGRVNDSTKGKRVSKEDEIQVDISGVYQFKDTGIGDSCLIGTDVYKSKKDYANAFFEGITACPEVLEIPGILKDSSGRMKIVEIIGRGAFICCGSRDANGITKSVKVPRQVKVIKFTGLGGMNDLEVFEIEAGSELEIVEDHGLDSIGRNTGQFPGMRTGILILPSTLFSVYSSGFQYCNLFDTIIYCGSHILSNFSHIRSHNLEYKVSSETVVKVTSRYPSNQNIFYRSPERSNPTEAEMTCSIMSGVLKYSLPKLMNILCASSSKLDSHIWVITFNLVL